VTQWVRSSQKGAQARRIYIRCVGNPEPIADRPMRANPRIMGVDNELQTIRTKKIWVDLDNSPHVPFFTPIIEELESRGFRLLVTARDCFQVCELADLFDLNYKRIGRHYGRNKLLKLIGLATRALQLAPTIIREKPDAALSHGSRSQLLAAAIMRIPSVVILDYEFVRGVVFIKPSWVIVPEVIPNDAIRFDPNRILRYPGIKEDVYVSRFRPDPAIGASLGLNGKDLLVTVRPPANEAHYHNPQSEELFAAVIDFLGRHPDARVILLPRNHRQEISLLRSYPALFKAGKLLVPKRAVDGLNLIWHSDLVISGGGTMNREAAALGVPVYSIFRGKIGAVDRYLADTGRLVLLESIEDVRTKIVLNRRRRPSTVESRPSIALRKIVDDIAAIVTSARPAPEYSVQ